MAGPYDKVKTDEKRLMIDLVICCTDFFERLFSALKKIIVL
jgi:hypothetical protein